METRLTVDPEQKVPYRDPYVKGAFGQPTGFQESRLSTYLLRQHNRSGTSAGFPELSMTEQIAGSSEKPIN
jgi:hypothetical protein